MPGKKLRRPVLTFATLALSIALGSSAALAARPTHAAGKPLVRSHAQVHGMNNPSAPGAFRPQPQSHVDDPLADLWLG
jgi:hypothetical protein